MNRSELTRKVERIVFKGVPEQPEPNHQTVGYGNANIRYSGRSSTWINESGLNRSKFRIYGKVTFDFDNNKIDLIKEI